MKKSILAKLLAKENITVQHGNYQTAWFDIKDRVLGLPLWKDMGNDVTDLLIGHEVGHALETPYEGWHDSPEKLEGCPRSYINVIEDARIERKIKSRYVGLIGPMARGYKKLFDEKFFGDHTDTNWNEVKLIDKINLQAKVGNQIDVPFTAEEQVYMDRAMTTVTFDEVVSLVRDVYEWTKENQEELLNKPEPQQSGEENNGDSSEVPNGHDDAQTDENGDDQSASGQDSEQNESDEETESRDSSGNSSTESDVQDNESFGVGVAITLEDNEKSLTDEEFRKNESSMLEVNEKGKQPLFIREYNSDILKDVIWSYSEISSARAKKFKQAKNDEYFSIYKEEIDKANFEYGPYIKNVKKNVNFAVKEFEMRKAAYRYSRSATSKTGSIDVNKVWSYKTNDDIFSRVTKLADAKNHGMMMIIDYSGSMSGVLGNVLDQVIHLSMFCKAVNIPFEVYAFTSSNPRFDMDFEYDAQRQRDGEAYHGGLSMPQLTSSSLKKSDFEESIKALYRRKCFDYYLERSSIAQCEEYGSTPLNAALIASHSLIKKFVGKHNVQNMNFVVISDGDTDGLSVVNKSSANHAEIEPSYRISETIVEIGGKKFKCHGTRNHMTKDLLNNIKNTFNATTLGFFIAGDRHQYNRKLEDVFYSTNKVASYWSEEGESFKKATQRTFSKNKCAIFNSVLGYDDFYVLKSQNLNTEADDFEVESDASKGQLTNAFKKHSRSKKVNKVLLTQFGKSVAL